MPLTAHKTPCATCPWRLDAEIGQFPPQAFRKLAASSYDVGTQLFQCHDTSDSRPIICAGFLARGATHNLSVRMAYSREDIEQRDRSGGAELYRDFRAMAIANGVAADDAVLIPCRNNDPEED